VKITARSGPDEEIPAEVRALLEQRAARIRALPPIADAEQASFWIAELAVGDETYALPLHQLLTALPLKSVTPVPLSPPHVVGILRYQVQILPVYSLAAVVGVRGWRVDPAILLVLEPRPGRRIAVDCEVVPKATALPMAMVEEARARGRGPILTVAGAARAQLQLIDDLTSLIDAGQRRDAR
jgi:chemotaxis signal transduction protein